MCKYKEKQGKELTDEAIRLGVELGQTGGESQGLRNDAVLQQRVRNAKAIQLANRTWVIALLSGIASVLSAIAAWVAVWKT